MNCIDARGQLPLLLYGDLQAEEARTVERHLASCPACRGEFAAFRLLRHDLDRAPIPAVQVDMGRIYQGAAARQARRLRRWRRTAVVLASAAAAALVLLLLRVELRVEANQLVIRWSSAPTAAPPALVHPQATPPAVADEKTRELTASLAQRLELANELVRALARDVETRDEQRRTELLRLRLQLEGLQQRENARYTETRHDVSALYQAQFGPPRKENER